MAKLTPRESALVLALATAVCLLAVAGGVPWELPITVAVTCSLVWAGYQLAGEKLSRDRARLEAQRQALDAEWRAVENVRRVRAVFLHARRAMQEEATRAMRVEQPRRDADPTLGARDVENQW